MLSVRFLGARKAVDVPFSDNDFLLSAVDLVDLVLRALRQLANFADHHLQVENDAVRLLVHVVELLYLFIDFFFFRERAQLPIDALNVELAAQVRDLLVPKLDHIHDSFIEAFSFPSNHAFQVLLWLLVVREYFRKDLIV